MSVKTEKDCEEYYRFKKRKTYLMLVECVDHGGIDVVDADAKDDNGQILANSCKYQVRVIHRSCYIAVLKCEIHASS